MCLSKLLEFNSVIHFLCNAGAKIYLSDKLICSIDDDISMGFGSWAWKIYSLILERFDSSFIKTIAPNNDSISLYDSL